jgi:ornithine cyclodeaminase/alanine dehydrogenase-like protein (mu-crystallin family)
VSALLLTRPDIRRLMAPVDWLDAVEAAFRASADGKADAPPPMHIGGSGGGFHAKAAAIDLDRRYVALKLNGNFPGNPEALGLPTIQGAILLCDGATGSLLAILDSIEVTLRRTAAATALAARYLARPDSRRVLICGCGAQAPAQLEALCGVLPLERGFAWDRDFARAEGLARSSPFPLAPIHDLAEAARASDVIVTCTTAREPFLGLDQVGPGTFVAAVGADSPDKSEIDPSLMAAGLVVADVLDQCAEMGDLRQAFAAGAMRREAVHGELADLVAGRRSGRTDALQITLFDSTGTALEDVAAAATAYRRAAALGGFARIDLGAQ